jgi:protein TonB
MTQRYAACAGLAAMVTAGIFVLMQTLIAGRTARLAKVDGGRIVEFVRLKRESATETKKRELPDRAGPADATPPEMDLSDVPPPDVDPGAATNVATGFQPTFDLGGSPQLGAAPGDTDVVPLVRVSPQYPPDAMVRGIEGWVHVRFTITTAGTVKGVEILDADPKGYFERAAVAAVKKYKYKAKVSNGTPVERPGVELVISFKLQR